MSCSACTIGAENDTLAWHGLGACAVAAAGLVARRARSSRSNRKNARAAEKA
ncbi:hypothetical protein A7982_12081 [Minicystis rosea]|nr:hypothetical protein A7982_12081 [Minicystis rosea]